MNKKNGLKLLIATIITVSALSSCSKQKDIVSATSKPSAAKLVSWESKPVPVGNVEQFIKKRLQLSC